jgi:CotH kinase protein
MGRGDRARSLAAVALATGLAACGSNEPSSPFAPTDPAGRLFEPGHVVEVSIEIAPGDWDTLRRQSRNWWDIVAADDGACMVQPFPKPFTWFTASITVDGLRRDRVAVRKKGFLGSLNEERPALKVRFDGYVEGQTLNGLQRLTLNNSVQDPTWLRQCLAYGVFEKAGIPVPWCNFAHLRVNGRDLGLYVHLESQDRHWVRRWFERDEGDLWEGEFSDFRTGWLDTFEKKGDVEEDDQTKVDRGSLAEVAAAVAPGTPDAQVRPRLESLLDLDGFVRFWAVEKVLEHWDGYANNTNNFFLYHDPATSKLVFAPSGTDQITVPDPNLTTRPPVSVYATAALANRLYGIGETRQLYAATIRRVLDQAFREDDLLSQIDRMQAVIAPVLARSGTEVVSAQTAAVEDLRSWVRGRRAVLLKDLEAGPPDWTQPLKPSICVDLAGEIEGTFTTTFGTNREPDAFATGNGTIAAVYRHKSLAIRRVGAQAGYDRNAQTDPWPVIDITAEATDGTYYNIWIGIDPQRFHAGARGSFDGSFAWGGMGQWNPRTWTWTYLGGFIDVGVEIDQAGLTPGSPVTGRFRSRVIQW